MKKSLFALAAFTALIFPVTLEADDKKSSASSGAAPATVGAMLSKVKLHRLDGKKFKEAELKKSPEFYILYYSASW